MPKPKRPRPPVVKTDWVVDEVRDEHCHYTPFATLNDAKTFISKCKSVDRELKRVTGYFSIYKRTWRKVDL